MITRKQFRAMIWEIAEIPSESRLSMLYEDLGYVEILVKLAVRGVTVDSFNDDEPLFVDGKINWPEIK